MSQMPIVKTTSLSRAEATIVEQCLNKGRLRATKPHAIAEVQYVWRNIAFIISPKRQHACMPFGCDYDLADSLGVPMYSEEFKRVSKFLNGVVHRTCLANSSAVIESAVNLGYV